MFSAALKHVMTGQSSLTVPGDSLLASNVLLLKTIGTNNATNASFIDSSSNNFTMSASGVVNQGSFSPYAPAGSWSAYFDGGVNNIYVAPNANLQFGTGDFCAEGWFWRPSSSSLQTLFSIGAYTDGLMFRSDYFSFRGEAVSLNSFLPTQKWFHAAVTRRLGVIYVFIDGLQVYSSSSATAAGNHAPTSATYIGGSSHTGGSENWTGYISGFRVVKGSSIYSGNFNPPTESLPATSGTSLLCLQYNRFVDFSNNGYALTVNGTVPISRFSPLALSWDSSLGGSASFSSSNSSRISTVNNDSFRFGTGDFCVEAWLYPSDTSPAQGIASIYGGWSLQLRTGAFQVWNGDNNLMGRSYTTKNSWVHVAWTRSGTSMRIFVNGVQQGATVTDSTNFTGGGTNLTVGDLTSGIGFLYTGHMSDLRIVKGSAVYTSNFAPPTVPLTAITNTSLLLNFNNAAVYDATRSSNLSLVGDTKTSTGQVKYATTSSLFDGTGDYATILPRPELAVGTGDFTWEAWIRPQTTSQQIWFASPGNGDRSGFAIGMRGGTMWWLIGDGSAWVFERDVGTALSINNWHHVAVCRASGTARLFVNGSLIDSIANTTNIGQGTRWDIGGYNTGYLLTGNMEDLRISRTARYTAAFTPPTRALPVSGLGSFSASGGTITTSGAYTIHTFTSSGSFVISGASSRDVEYLVVAGGGGGGGYIGGGGGGGGVRTGTLTAMSAGTYTVTVGAGGAGGVSASGSSAGDGGNGENSVFSTITAAGGGGGAGAYSKPGKNGGSGGGGSNAGGLAGSGNTPSTSPAQGNNGGAGGPETNYGSGGGGGAGSAGNAGATTGGAGGTGVSSAISGTQTGYGGGGGGASYFSTGGAGGGSGGGYGGAGSGSMNAYYPQAGTANRGGGGGGGVITNYPDLTTGPGAAGGSGIVIVRYLT